MNALDDVRVLDLTIGPVGGVAMMVLADFGAEVLRLERDTPHPLDRLPAAPMWRRGTRTVHLDLAAERERFDALCAAADVMVCNWRPSARQRAGLDVVALRRQHPHLVICSVTSFGAQDPRSELPGYEHVIAAASGRMASFAGCADRDGPVFSALQVGVHACAQTVVSGVLAALLAAREDGQGCLVETSMLEAMLAYEQGAMIGEQFRERFGPLVDALPGATAQAPMPTLHYLPTQAGDGRWVQLGNLLPHLFDNFLLATDLFEILADPEFDSAQMNLPETKREEFRERMFARMQEKSAVAWMDTFIANGGVVAAKVQSTQEALEDADIVANGHVIERGDGLQLGPLAACSRTPAAPGFGAQPGDPLEAAWRAAPRGSVAFAEHTRLPLHGVRVIEIATIIAAPFGASLLADLGADVVKVEPLAGDPYRGLAGGVGATRVNLGKQSVCVDLKSDAGQKAVLDLLADADVLIHNFRPGVPEKLGIGYEAVSAVNPGIVYLQSNGYGPHGPGAHRPSTHPVPGAAMGGVHFQMGGRLPDTLLDMAALRDWSRRLMRANEVNPDPNTALVVASSVLLALAARQRHGCGQLVCVDMFGANAYANADDFLRYPGKAARSMPDEQLLGLGANYRLYRCGDGRWIFVAAASVEMLAEIVGVPENVLEDSIAGQPQAFWLNVFRGTDVACVAADASLPKDFWLAPEQQGFLVDSHHGEWGAFKRPGPLCRFDRQVPASLLPPLQGEHTRALLKAEV